MFDWKKKVLLTELVAKSGSKQMNRVLCLDVHPEGEYLVAGYQDRTIKLWDLKKMKVYYSIEGKHEHEIEHVKFLSANKLSVVGCDRSGLLYKYTVKRSMFMLDHDADIVIKDKLTNVSSITPFQVTDSMPRFAQDWKDINLVAISTYDMVMLAHLGDHPRKMHTAEKPEYLNEDCLSYTSWGTGFTPSHRDEKQVLLAVAGGNIVEIIIVNDPYAGEDGI